MTQKQADAIDLALEGIEADTKAVLDLTANLLKADRGQIYFFDFLANAAVKRALALSSGLAVLVRERNATAAGALVRLHLDTALRFSAGFIVADPHDFARQVFEGSRIDRMKDMRGKRMTDKYLVSQLAREYPWISDVYDQTSGYVHLSNKHIFSMIRGSDEGSAKYQMHIGARDELVPDALFLEMIVAFRGCTEILVSYIEGWTWTKNNPEKVTELRNRIGWPHPNAHD